jgi:integrase
MGKSLNIMVKSIIKELEKTNLSCGTLKRYLACFNSITKYCVTQDLKPIYSKKLIEGFLSEMKASYDKNEISYTLLRDRRKAAHLITEYNKTGTYVPKHFFQYSKYTLTSPYFIKFLHKYCKYYKETYHLSEACNEQNYYVTKKFCFYLESISFKNFINLTINEIIDFINSLKETNKGNIKIIIRHVKKMLIHLDKKDIVHINLDFSILKPQFIPPKEVITFSKEEIVKILNAIDRNTDVGKRDYAIILLGITTGLRAIDIVSTKLTSIDWKKETIKIIQKKTGKEIEIPLLSNTSNALASYILSGRQKLNNNFIFLTVRNPTIQLNGPSLNNILRKYCKKANVFKERKGTFHSLRRSFCTWLSQDLIPVDLIAECAGHSNVHTADRYISVSPIMVQCCLDFSGIQPLNKEVENV